MIFNGVSDNYFNDGMFIEKNFNSVLVFFLRIFFNRVPDNYFNEEILVGKKSYLIECASIIFTKIMQKVL